MTEDRKQTPLTQTQQYGLLRIKWEDYNYISAIFSKGGLSVGIEKQISFEDAFEINKMLADIAEKAAKIDKIFDNAIKKWTGA
jgi:hypothetical protein